MKFIQLSRRNVLGAALFTAGGVFLGGAPALGAERPATGFDWTGTFSANGWPVIGTAPTFRVEGSNQSVNLADGDPATILLHVARRFNYEICTIPPGELDGHTSKTSVSQRYESNYLSGSAVTIRGAIYPLGAKDSFYSNELKVIRDIISEMEGVVSWGGDEAVPKESHFQLALPPGHERVVSVANRIRGWDKAPGNVGAGTINAFDT